MNCSRCKQPRSRLDFARNHRKRSGRQFYCRACNAAAQREWYHRDKARTRRDRLALDHLGIVRMIVLRCWPNLRHDTFEDAVAAGTVGLLQAASRFRPGAQTFSAYAEHRIRGAVQDHMRSWFGRSPRRVLVLPMSDVIERLAFKETA